MCTTKIENSLSNQHESIDKSRSPTVINIGNISLCLPLVPDSISNYIYQQITLVKNIIGLVNLKGVILFGSAVSQTLQQVSDVDIVIIIDNKVPKSMFRKLKSFLQALEIKYKFDEYRDSWPQMVLRAVERSTGMFCSHFLTYEKAWKKQSFSKVFSTNAIITKLLAPYRIVFDSMKAGGYVVYCHEDMKDFCLNNSFNEKCSSYQDLEIKITKGKEGLHSLEDNKQFKILNNSNFKNSYSPLELVKSLLMNTAISFGIFAVSPLVKDPIKYSLEAIKWALRSVHFYHTHKREEISLIVKEFQKRNLNGKFMKKFLMYRKIGENSRDFSFLVLSIKAIWKIHKIAWRWSNIKQG